MSEQTNGNGTKTTVIQHEAPVSATVKLVGQKGGDILFTVRSCATPTQIEQTLDNLVHALQYAEKNYHLQVKTNGAPAPATNGNATQAQPAPPAQVQAPEGEAPVCPLHNRAMKTSNFGGWYCTAKNQDGSYCENKVGAG